MYHLVIDGRQHGEESITGARLNIRNNGRVLPYYVLIRRGIVIAGKGEDTSDPNARFSLKYTVPPQQAPQFIYGDALQYDMDTNVYNVENNAIEYDSDATYFDDTHLPTGYVEVMTARLLLPEYSVDLFTNTRYAFFIYTYLYGKRITLCGAILSRHNAKAMEPVTIKGVTYYEYLDVPFVNPQQIYDSYYGAGWDNFRTQYLNLSPNSNNNDIESPLCFDLLPVKETARYANTQDEVVRTFTLIDGYQGGTNTLQMQTEYIDEYNDKYTNVERVLASEYNNNTVKLAHVDVENNDGLRFKLTFVSNIGPVSGWLDGFNRTIEYYVETYYGIPFTNLDNAVFTLYLGTVDNVIASASATKQFYPLDFDTNNVIFGQSDIGPLTWQDYDDGMIMWGVIAVYGSGGEEVCEFVSNVVPLTADLFAYLASDNVYSDSNYTNYIDLNSISNMNVYNIDAVNKIVNEVVTVQKTEGYRTNIQQPIFIQAQKADGIEIHRGVREHIALNLDMYRAYTNMFYLRINGIDFPEYARNVYGVIFPIDGNMLGDAPAEGTYFILDANRDTVTNGKYIIN